MHKASPEAFKVNKQAIHNITSNEVKHQHVQEIITEVDPLTDEKTNGLNKIGRKAIKAAIHIIIKKTVGKAVNALHNVN
ncbi:hypothetical protein I4U23_031477 [Adineta vaga]|nr:hypothetical protein I4U23_031477 [Adineta vaga]